MWATKLFFGWFCLSSEIFIFQFFVFVRNHLIKIPAKIEKSSAASLPRTFASESEFNDNRLELIYSFTYVHRGRESRARKTSTRLANDMKKGTHVQTHRWANLKFQLCQKRVREVKSTINWNCAHNVGLKTPTKAGNEPFALHACPIYMIIKCKLFFERHHSIIYCLLSKMIL